MALSADYYQKGIEKLFHIVNKETVAVPFILNHPQKRILHNLSNMDIILKARQEGISALILAIFTLDFLVVENSRSVVISHEEKATQRLFDRIKYYLYSMEKTWPGPPPYELKYNSRKELVNLVNGATFYLGTAGSRSFGHGDTITNLHISELSRWPEQENMMTGLLQAVPKDGRIIVETTANGYGDYFYKLWQKNKDTQYPFRTHFIPWFELADYQMPDNDLGDPTEDELQLQNAYHLNRNQLAWRRWKLAQLNDNIDKFNEQFPATAEEAFIVSGSSVWSPTLLTWYIRKTQPEKYRGGLRGFDPVNLELNEKGHLRMWKPPEEFHYYVIGCDVSEGKVVTEMEGGKERDASCAQVLDKTTFEQVAVWHGRIDPDQLGRELELLGKYYNNALIAVERNAIGMTPLIVLRDLNYPNLYYREKVGEIAEKITAQIGWVTDRMTKEMLISDGTNLLRDKRLRLYDENTISEMLSYVRDADGHANAAKSAFDDRVMALLIAIRMLSRPQSRYSGNEIEQRSSDLLQSGGFFMGGVSFDKDGMPAGPDQEQQEQPLDF